MRLADHERAGGVGASTKAREADVTDQSLSGTEIVAREGDPSSLNRMGPALCVMCITSP
jgi:hypothetical protein